MTTGTMNLPERNVSADGSIVVEYRDSNHTYKVNGEPTPSVSGVIGCYDKPALVGAAANVTLDGVATAHRRKGVDLSIFNDARALGDHLRKHELRHWQVWGRAADRGTFVHAVLQAWIEDARIPTSDDVPADYRQYVRAFGNFVVAHQPESVTSEVIVASVKHGYAGRYDWTQRLTKVCDVQECGCRKIVDLYNNERAIADFTVRTDFKTSKAVYAENFDQLDLYEVAAQEMGEPEADHRAILRLGKDGAYEFVASRTPVGDSLGRVAGFKARKRNEDLYADLNPRRRRRG